MSQSYSTLAQTNTNEYQQRQERDLFVIHEEMIFLLTSFITITAVSVSEAGENKLSFYLERVNVFDLNQNDFKS